MLYELKATYYQDNHKNAASKIATAVKIADSNCYH